MRALALPCYAQLSGTDETALTDLYRYDGVARGRLPAGTPGIVPLPHGIRAIALEEIAQHDTARRVIGVNSDENRAAIRCPHRDLE